MQHLTLGRKARENWLIMVWKARLVLLLRYGPGPDPQAFGPSTWLETSPGQTSVLRVLLCIF